MLHFDTIWKLLSNHGSSDRRRAEASDLWKGYTPEQQQQIFDAIRHKLSQGKFVNYDPVRALIENVPKQQLQQMSYEEYYAIYHTTEPKDGWSMVKPQQGAVYYVRPQSV